MSEISKTKSDTPDRELQWRGRLMRWGKRMIVVSLLFATILLTFCWLTPAPEKQLAAFDAARAVPDEDNAALIYAELLQGEEVPLADWVSKMAPLLNALMDPMSLQESNAASRELRELELSEGISDPNAARVIGSRPWKSADCPELKQWLDKHQNRIGKLQEAARKPSCQFPVSPTSGRMSLFDVPVGVFRQNALLLMRAANNDFGEGDIDGGLAKCQSLLSIGRHFREQPSTHCLSSGIACEAMALHRLAEFVVEGHPTDRHLRDLAVQCQNLNDEWELLRRDISRIRDIFSGLLDDRRPIRFRVSMWYYRVRHNDKGWLEDRIGQLYHRMLSEQRGLRILIELRRFKDQTGQWPESLDQIASSLPPKALIDPSSDGPYVYRLSEHGFSLYSVGPNHIDEKGQNRSNGPDDWPIWPPRGRSPEPKQNSAVGV
jgi:hypothetical protein